MFRAGYNSWTTVLGAILCCQIAVACLIWVLVENVRYGRKWPAKWSLIGIILIEIPAVAATWYLYF
jgi:hypothetical protein